MHILVCPDSFKGSLSAQIFCEIVGGVMKTELPDALITLLPLADGGEGTLDCLAPFLTMHQWMQVNTLNALYKPIKASYLTDGKTAYIEMAAASGLTLIPQAGRDIMHSGSLGTGLLVTDAIQRGHKQIILFAGGTATVDGRIGIAAALGYKYYDVQGYGLPSIAASLPLIAHWDCEMPEVFAQVAFTLCVDVTNKICGESGAAAVYGPQKGATEGDLILLDNGLKHYATFIREKTDRDIFEIPGGGAGGGVAASLYGLLNANIIPATDLIFELTHLQDHLTTANLVITGEGKFDEQSFQGKLTGRIIEKCTGAGIDCIVITGINNHPDTIKHCKVYSLARHGAEESVAIQHAEERLQDAALAICREIKKDI
ncbi:MAG: glycerate kinase [Saprospiraceae bacterium]|nr:glycerate kinase [Saprospiraceae bacterium]